MKVAIENVQFYHHGHGKPVTKNSLSMLAGASWQASKGSQTANASNAGLRVLYG